VAKELIFRVKVVKNGDTLRMVPVKPIDPLAGYIFSGTWRKKK